MGIFEDLSIQKEQPRLLDIEEGLYRCSPRRDVQNRFNEEHRT